MSEIKEEITKRQMALKQVILSGSADTIDCLIAKIKTSSEIKTKEDCIKVMEELVRIIREE